MRTRHKTRLNARQLRELVRITESMRHTPSHLLRQLNARSPRDHVTRAITRTMRSA